MSATDELRRLLDERGVPYETNDDMGASETRWNGFTAYQLTPNAKLVMHPTPEQAIAATLGGGKLTAEQVRECVEDLYWEGYNDGYVHRGHGIEETDWQTITDKLNAAWNSRAERTCCIESSYLNDFTSNHECWYEFEMQCGYKFTWDEMEPPNYCPNCGREVVDA